jgi:hypothetical protein
VTIKTESVNAALMAEADFGTFTWAVAPSSRVSAPLTFRELGAGP